ncbi:MAG: T9SS type A sorting domain-containing protein [Candidatus Azobacteroides sp.]|nr:T9SS type A sorting domain-containing protein [Candidatus Azobacteroides sp.]
MKKLFSIFFMAAFAFTANISAAEVVIDGLAGKNIGDALSVFSKNGDGKITVTVAADPSTAGTKGNCAHIVTTDYDAFWQLDVTLPAGKTIADYGALKFDMYTSATEYKQMNIYIDGKQFYVDAGYPSQGSANTWNAKSYSLEGATTTADNTFTLALGISHEAGNYYITNVRLEEVISPDRYLTLDFEGYTLGESLPVISKNGDGKITATVVDDPSTAGTHGQCAHIVTTDYDAFLSLAVTLPDGKTLADYDEFSFDLYTVQQEYKQMNIYIDGSQFYVDAGYPAQGSANTWVTKTYSLAGATSGNPVTLAFGMSHEAGNYYLDNVTLRAKENTGVPEISVGKTGYFSDNILYVGNAQAEEVYVYDTNGRLLVAVKNVSTVDLTNLTNGIYIAKIIAGGQTETVKIAK